MFDCSDLTHLDAKFLCWMVFALEPGHSRLEDVTINSLAEDMHTNWNTMNASLGRCRGAGFIAYEFPRGHKGWVELLGVENLVARTRWLAAQIAKAQVTSDFQVVALPPESQTRPAETSKALYDSLVGEDDAARASGDRLPAMEGSSQGTQVARPPASRPRLRDKRDPRARGFRDAAAEYVNTEPYRRGVAQAMAEAHS
jgi:hypothetical protein